MMQTVQRFVLFLVAFSLPLQGLNMGMGPLTVTPTMFTSTILLVLAGMQFTTGTTRPANRDSKAAWVAIFAVSYSVSTVMSIVRGAPLPELSIQFKSHASLVLYYFLLVYVVRSLDDLRLFLWALVLGGAFTAAPAVFGLQTGLRLPGAVVGTRFEGLAGQENVFGRDMAVCVGVAAALLFSTRSWFRKAVAAGSAVMALLGVMMSLSRAAYLGLAGMVGLWIFRSGRISNLKYAFPALLILVGVVMLAPASVRYRASTVYDPELRREDSSIQSRYEHFEWGLKAFMSSPLLGVGNDFNDWLRKYTGGKEHYSIHNGYMAVLASQGLFGLTAFLALLTLSWLDYSRARRAAMRRRSLGDNVLREIGHYATFLQIAYLSTLIGAVAHPATTAKTMWTLYALSAVVWGLARQRVRELEARNAVEEREAVALASPLGMKPVPAEPWR
jgi:O-antigen ligase